MNTTVLLSAPAAIRSPLGPAFAASIALHAAIALVLVGILSTGRIAFGDGNSPLAVRLVNVKVGERERPSPPVVEPAPPMPIATSPEAAPQTTQLTDHPTPPSPRTAAIVPEIAAASPAPALAVGTFGVKQSPGGITILSEALQLRSQGEYPVEIDKPVTIVVAPAVAYPPAAAKVNREGAAVAWVAVGADGQIEEVIVEGDPEFGDAVAAAIPAAKFLPAENRGSPIRFFAILTFEFRAGQAAASPRPEAAVP